MTRRLARFRAIYVNQVPVWECGRCGTRRHLSIHEDDLRAHEAVCGQNTEEPQR